MLCSAPLDNQNFHHGNVTLSALVTAKIYYCTNNTCLDTWRRPASVVGDGRDCSRLVVCFIPAGSGESESNSGVWGLQWVASVWGGRFIFSFSRLERDLESSCVRSGEREPVGGSCWWWLWQCGRRRFVSSCRLPQGPGQT